MKKLLDVKSIVTLSLTAVFIVEVLRGRQDMATIYLTIIAFYFGTQKMKNERSE